MKPRLTLAAISVLLLIVGFMPTAPAAEETATVGEFLATALEDQSVAQREEVTRFLEEAPGGFPFLRSLEFRTETDRFALSNQKYALRYYPGSLSEHRSSRAWRKQAVTTARQEQVLQLHLALVWRYRLVLEYLHAQEQLELNRDLLQLRRDRLQVLNRSSASLDFDFEDLVRAQERYTETELELIELEIRERQLSGEIHHWLPAGTRLACDREALPAADWIAGLLDTLSLTAIASPYLSASRAEVELAGAEYDLKRTQARRIINFFEMTWDNENRLEPHEALFVEFGLKIPLRTGDQPELNRSQLKQLTATAAYEEANRELAFELAQVESNLRGLLAQVSRLAAFEAEAPATAALTTLKQYEGASPLSLLRLRESVIKRELQQTSLLYSLRIEYINLLDLSGVLASSPLRNWLSGELEKLEPPGEF